MVTVGAADGLLGIGTLLVQSQVIESTSERYPACLGTMYSKMAFGPDLLSG